MDDITTTRRRVPSTRERDPTLKLAKLLTGQVLLNERLMADPQVLQALPRLRGLANSLGTNVK